MKIIKKGRYPKEDWKGKQITCPKCGTIFLAETNDIITQDYEYYFVYCPLAVCDQHFALNMKDFPHHVREHVNRKAESERHRMK